jgi:hypothetical protein
MTKTLMPFALLCALIPAAHAEPGHDAAKDAVDISSVKDTMKIVTDGKGHYMVFPPIEKLSEFLFYGDGKAFWRQRTFSGGSEGTIRFSRTFWEPRTRGASFELKDKKYWAECGERKVEMKPLTDAETKAMLGTAAFHGPRWTWRAYLLARDEDGKYYYVDRQREPEDSKNFRLFVGPKGNLKLQKMTNVVSDTEGDIFATKTGTMRLISGKNEFTWISNKSKLKLTKVPVEDNAAMIYSELGVYTGELLGTPCDDF